MSTDQSITSGATILVVDDMPMNVQVLTKILREHEYHVRSASNGMQAVASAQQNPPDLILLDVVMPGMSGHEVCAKLKADVRTRDIPVIFISASQELLDKVRAFFAGGVDYITAPFQVDEVLARVETHLSLRNLQKYLQQKNAMLEQEIVERQRIEEALRESEQRYRRLVELSPDAILVVQADRCVYVNPAALHLLGAAIPDELVGTAFWDRVHPAFQENLKAYLQNAAEDAAAQLTPVESRVIRLDGKDLLVDVIIAPILYQNARAIQFIVRDITTRKRAENLLRESEHRYRSMVQNAAIGIFQVSPEGKFIMANPALARMLGYATPRQLLATVTNVAEQVYVAPRHWTEITEIVRLSQEPAKVETRCRYKDGGELIVSLNIWAVQNDQGQVRYFEGFLEDITERKQIEKVVREHDILLRGIASAMNRLLVITDLTASISDVLEILGFVTGIDRIAIFEIHQSPNMDERLLSQRFTWAPELNEVQMNIPDLQQRPFPTACHRWYDILHSNTVISGTVQSFPQPECALFEVQGIRSVLLAPIVIQHDLWGFIRFDDCQTERHWSYEDKSLLLAMAGSIGGAIDRQQTRDRFITTNAELAATLEALKIRT